MNKVLVTGASGYIALHTIYQLLQKNYQVRGTIRNSAKKNEIHEYLQKKVVLSKI